MPDRFLESDPSKKIPAAFIEELGKLINSFLAEREWKRQTDGEPITSK